MSGLRLWVLGVLLLPVLAFGFEQETTDDEECGEAPGVNCAHNGIPLVWDFEDMPIPVVVNTANSGVGFSAAFSAVSNSFESWEDASGRTIRFSASSASGAGSNGNDNVNVVSWVNLPDSGSFGQSIITFSSSTGRIFDVDVELNTDFEWAVLPPESTPATDDRADIQSVVTHEAGHFLGLDHENTMGPQVVMFYTDTTGSTAHRTLSLDDENGVLAIYAGGSGGGGGGGGGGSGGCSANGRSGESAPAAATVIALGAWALLRRQRRVARVRA